MAESVLARHNSRRQGVIRGRSRGHKECESVCVLTKETKKPANKQANVCCPCYAALVYSVLPRKQASLFFHKATKEHRHEGATLAHKGGAVLETRRID